jgi:curved DNA-binding protein CbpA
MDPYLVLQVAPDADLIVIAAAYRALARRYHPDVAGEGGTAQMRRINAAWEVLKDPVRRREHDQRRGADTAAHSFTATAPPPGTGAAGRPPGRPSGSVLTFGRHVGWSLGEILRIDPGYLEWLDAKPEGRPYREEIDRLLKGIGWRKGRPAAAPMTGNGWFRRASVR